MRIRYVALGAVFALVLSGCLTTQSKLEEKATREVEEAERAVSSPVTETDVQPQTESTSSTTQQVKSMMNENNPVVILKTNYGDITIELFTDKSPKTVANFLKLSNEDFYDGTLFHRVIPDFMIQGGDPKTKTDPDNWAVHGTGDPGYKFADEFNDVKLVYGSVAMANSGPNTNGSQFFIVTAPATPWLDKVHTNFGQVLSGMDVVEAIAGAPRNRSNHPTADIRIDDVVVEK